MNIYLLQEKVTSGATVHIGGLSLSGIFVLTMKYQSAVDVSLCLYVFQIFSLLRKTTIFFCSDSN